MKHVVLATCLIVVGRKTAMSTTLNIGILNLMHDKVDTQKRFSHVLTQTDLPVAITYFYPVTHYRGRVGTQNSGANFATAEFKLDSAI